jgi:hypothetical protein
MKTDDRTNGDFLARTCAVCPSHRETRVWNAFWAMVSEVLGPSQRYGSSNINEGRNWLSAWFLAQESRFERCLWLDDDIYLRPQDLWELVSRAWRADLDILGAPYAMKSMGCGHIAVGWDWDQTSSITVGEGGGIVPIEWMGAGCLVIHRRVFERIRKYLLARGDRELHYPFRTAEAMPGMRFWRNTEMPGKLGRYVEGGEDCGFFRLVRATNSRSFVDTRFRVLHEGPHMYDVADALYPRVVRSSVIIDRPSKWAPWTTEEPCSTSADDRENGTYAVTAPQTLRNHRERSAE